MHDSLHLTQQSLASSCKPINDALTFKAEKDVLHHEA